MSLNLLVPTDVMSDVRELGSLFCFIYIFIYVGLMCCRELPGHSQAIRTSCRGINLYISVNLSVIKILAVVAIGPQWNVVFFSVH
jgi:hypothetical protein